MKVQRQRGTYSPAHWRPRPSPVNAPDRVERPSRTWSEFTKNLWPSSPATKVVTSKPPAVAAWVAAQLRQREAYAVVAKLGEVASDVLTVAGVETPVKVLVTSLPAPWGGVASRDDAGRFVVELDVNRAVKHVRLTTVLAHELAHLVAGHVPPGNYDAKALPAGPGSEYRAQPIEIEAADLGARIEAYILKRWGRLDALVAQVT